MILKRHNTCELFFVPQTTTVMGCRYDDAEQQYVSNLKQIVEDFRVIGHGLVETVTDVTQLGG